MLDPPVGPRSTNCHQSHISTISFWQSPEGRNTGRIGDSICGAAAAGALVRRVIVILRTRRINACIGDLSVRAETHPFEPAEDDFGRPEVLAGSANRGVTVSEAVIEGAEHDRAQSEG